MIPVLRRQRGDVVALVAVPVIPVLRRQRGQSQEFKVPRLLRKIETRLR